MKKLTPLVLVLAAAAAAAAAPPARAQDVMQAAPEHYRVLLDNPYVRVVENTLLPGEKDPMHTHPAGWYYITQPGRMRVVFATGQDLIWAPAAGESGWSQAEAAHTSENIGDAPMSYVLVELKPAAPAATRVARRPPARRPYSPGRPGSR